MAEQLTIYNSNGAIQFDSRFQTYSLAYVFTTTVSFLYNTTLASGQAISINEIYLGSEYTNFPITDSDIAAIEIQDNHWYGVTRYQFTNGFYGLNMSMRVWTSQPAGSTATVYVYRQTKDIGNPSNFGLQLYNAANELTYDSNKYPTKVVSLIQDGGSAGVGSKVAICPSTTAWRREIDPAFSSTYWKDTYRTTRRSGSTVSSYPLVFGDSRNTGNYGQGVYADAPQKDIIFNVADIDMSLVGAVPAPPPNASRSYSGPDGELSLIKLRITAASGTVNVRFYETVSHSFGSSSSVNVTATVQYRNVTLGSGWTNVPGASQSGAASITYIPGEPPYRDEYSPSINTNMGVTPGHVYEFRYTNTQSPTNRSISISNTFVAATLV